MDDSIYTQIKEAINDRSSWESKISSYYDMRFEGIRRLSLPYKNAPDTHYPLVDTVIEKLKPFYAQQLYADQVLATFVAQDPVPRSMVAMAEQWFDYKVKQCSNFERAIMNAIDMMLHYGFCPVKIFWDESSGNLGFEAVDPMYVIVPKTTDVDTPPDFLVHVKVMSRAQYVANKLFPNKDKDFVDSIVGRGGSASSSTTLQRDQSMAQREGLLYSNDNKRITVWEVYTKTDAGWQIDTIAPVLGPDTVLRPSFMLTYEHGQVPFVCLRNETTTKGWYSPRGIAETLFQHEMALNKTWNSILQFLDFTGHPVFKNDSLSPINAQSFQAAPGRILPSGVDFATAPDAPLDLQKQMEFVRALAEDRIQIPDLNQSGHLTGNPGIKGEVTATQVNAVVGLSSQSNDLRARNFRHQLEDIYGQAWSLLKQFAADQLNFVTDNQYQALPQQLLEKDFAIHPSGSADSWNKAYRIQDATMTYQMLLGKPNVNQDQLIQYYLEAKDPRLIKRLYQDTGFGDQLQQERQANELLLMQEGFPPIVKPDDNDAIHLQEIPQWLQLQMAKGKPPSAPTAGLVLKHIMQHAQQGAGKQDKNAMQVMKAMGPTTNALQAIMAQGGMQDPAAGANAQAGMQQKESISINYKDAPDSIKRQMEMAAGFQPALGEPSQDDKKLAVTAATKNGANGSGDQAPAQPAAPAKPPDPPQLHVHVPDSITHHIPAPVVHVPAPVVHVQPPDVHLPQQPAPVVHVHPTPVNVNPAPVHVQHVRQPLAPAKKRKIRVIRDEKGVLQGAEEE